MRPAAWWRIATLVVAIAGIPSAAAAQEAGLSSRVLVLPVEGQGPRALGALPEDVADALSRGAERMTPTVARATAPVEDTAVIVGCDPGEPECLDAVAAALNVDQLLLSQITVQGNDAEVAVTAITREAEPVQKTFVIRAASRDADLLALEEAVPVMLEAGEARKRDVKEPPPPPDKDPPPAPPPRPAAESSVAPWVVVGVGVVAAAAGGGAWFLASQKQGDIDDAPTDTPSDLERLEDLEADARLYANVGNVLVGVGVLAIAGGVTWALVSGGDEAEPVRAAPLVVPGGGGLAIGGAW